ncbi:MAG: twin-arginine translocase TatA/TatE family subunit [Pseudomonadota bacterium]
MFNIGFNEFLAIGIIALLVIGPKQLPEVAKVVGRLIGELKKATQDLSGGLLEASREVRSTIEETKVEMAQQVDDFKEDLMSDGHSEHEDHHDQAQGHDDGGDADGKS